MGCFLLFGCFVVSLTHSPFPFSILRSWKCVKDRKSWITFFKKWQRSTIHKISKRYHNRRCTCSIQLIQLLNVLMQQWHWLHFADLRHLQPHQVWAVSMMASLYFFLHRQTFKIATNLLMCEVFWRSRISFVSFIPFVSHLLGHSIWTGLFFQIFHLFQTIYLDILSL